MKLNENSNLCLKLKGDQTDICKLILAKGDLQVSEKERQAQQEAMFKGDISIFTVIITILNTICFRYRDSYQ